MGGDADNAGEAALAALWEEDEIKAIMHEVQTRKSVDTQKLFGGPNGTLPAALSKRTPSEVKDRIDHVKGSFDSDVASFAPKCGVPELLAVLTSEAAFCRSQRARRPRDLERLATERAEREKLDAARKDARREASAAARFLQAEIAARRAAEKQKEEYASALNDAKTQLDEEHLHRQELEADLDVLKQKEVDQRRRLDRARLKVAALRGEMVAPTMDELVPASLATKPEFWMPDPEEILKTHLEPYFGIFPGDGEDEQGVNDKETSNSETNGGEMNNGETNAMDVDAHLSSSSPGRNDGLDVKPKGKPADTESTSKTPGRGAAAGGVKVENDVALGEIAESSKAGEIRLLRNRVEMHVEEAKDWSETAAAERRRARLLAASRQRLEEDAARMPNFGQPPSAARPSARSRAKRVAPRQVSAAASAPLPWLPPVAPAHAAVAPPQPSRKRRKGTPQKGISVA